VVAQIATTNYWWGHNNDAELLHNRFRLGPLLRYDYTCHSVKAYCIAHLLRETPLAWHRYKRCSDLALTPPVALSACRCL
jgi:hypothetical protein